MPNRREAYADMERYKKTKNAQRERYYRRTAFKYSYKYWTKEEDNLVLEHKMSDSMLSVLIERSVGAIQTRRAFLKKWESLLK